MTLWSLDEEGAINVGGAAYQVWLMWMMDVEEEGGKVVRGKQRLCVLFFPANRRG